MSCPSVVCLSVTYVLLINGTSYRKLSEEANMVAHRHSVDPLRPSVHPNRGTDCTPNTCFGMRIVAKPIQLAAWLLLTAYRNLPTPYPTVPSPTPDGHLFSQNSCDRPSLSPQTGLLTLPQILGLQIAAKGLQISTWSLLTVYRSLPTPCPMIQSPTSYGHLFSQNRGPDQPPPSKKLHVARQYDPSDSWASCFLLANICHCAALLLSQCKEANAFLNCSKQ